MTQGDPRELDWWDERFEHQRENTWTDSDGLIHIETSHQNYSDYIEELTYDEEDTVDEK